MEEPRTTEQPAAAEGDPSKTESPTPAPAGGDAEAEESVDWRARADQYKQELLNQKPKIEEANRILAERETRPLSPAATEAADEETDYLEGLAQDAAAGDRTAKALLYERQERIKSERRTYLREQLGEITDPDLRERTKQHFLKNQHRLGDIKAARAELAEPGLAAENERLKKALALAETNRRDPNEVARVDREVTATEHKVRKMTTQEFDAKQRELTPAAGRALQRELRTGQIVLTDI